MARELFVDTGAWFALQVPDDAWHGRASATLKAIVAGGYRLATTNLVVGETYTLMLRTHGHGPAWRFVEKLRESPRVVIAHVDDAIEREAWRLLRRFDDQRFSFVDGSSFAFMRKRRLKEAFAFDRHFSAAGFVRIPVDEPLR